MVPTRWHRRLTLSKVTSLYVVSGVLFITGADALQLRDGHPFPIIPSLVRLGFLLASSSLLYWLVKYLLDEELGYRVLAELSPQPILILADGHWIYANPAAVELLRAESREALIGKTLLDILCPEDYQNVAQNMRRMVDYPQFGPIERTLIRLDGSSIDAEVRAAAFQYKGKTAVQFNIRDVTQRKRIEQALRTSEAQLKEALRMGKMGYFEQDLVNNVRTWSDEKCHIFGIEPEEFDGSLEMFLAFVHPEDRDHVRNTITTSSDAGGYDVEYRIIRRDGSIRNLHAQSKLIYDDEGLPIRLIGTIQDITEWKQAEQLMRESEKLSVVGQLAAGVAHEIRNPLTALKGFTHLFPDSSPESQRTYADIMKDELARIERIVTEMLMLAKPQAVAFKPVDLRDKISEVVTLLSTQAIMNNVEITTLVADDAPIVSCEENQLIQVFINVTKNAIEAMPHGGKLCIRAAVAGGEVEIVFTDTGPGIDSENIEKLGRPFYTTKQTGTGLGLLVSRKIINIHKGTLDISSQPGEGTTVRISLPVNSAPHHGAFLPGIGPLMEAGPDLQPVATRLSRNQ